MKTSDSILKLAPALLRAQKAITFAVKDQENPHFHSFFAGLPSVIDTAKPALNEAGISFIQTPSPSEAGKLALTTRLIHESGEWLEDTAVCPLPKDDPQGYGSAMTYLRRYSLASVIGIYQDDDDGQGAIRSESAGSGAQGKKQADPTSTSIPSDLPKEWVNWTLNERGENRAHLGMTALSHWFNQLEAGAKKLLMTNFTKDWTPIAKAADKAEADKKK